MTRTDGAVQITPHSRVVLPELSIVADGQDYVVGDAARGVFVNLPAIGVRVLHTLGQGATVQEATDIVSAEAGEEVDVADFVAVLAQCGLLSAIDGVSLLQDVVPPSPQPVRTARWAGWMFGPAAWLFYGVCTAWVIAALCVRPQYAPSFEDWLVVPDPAASAAIALAIALAIGVTHEWAHVLAARAQGVNATMTIGRRAFLPAFETDLTPLWSVPRHRRFSPLLAGLAVQSVIVAASLSARMLAATSLSPVANRLLADVVLIGVITALLQCLLTLRTDLYLVLITALGCRNLSRVTRLYLQARLFRLSPAQREELAQAHSRDLALAPWFGLLQIGSAALLAYLFLTYWLPSTAMMSGWVILSLIGTSPATRGFWESLALAAMLVLPAVTTCLVWWRQRRHRKGER